jgi:hypothetical protein
VAGGQNENRFGQPLPRPGDKSAFAVQPPPRRGETTTVMGWKRDSSAAALAGCPVARLPGCPVARLPGCPVARLPGCPVARLPGCPSDITTYREIPHGLRMTLKVSRAVESSPFAKIIQKSLWQEMAMWVAARPRSRNRTKSKNRGRRTRTRMRGIQFGRGGRVTPHSGLMSCWITFIP